MSVLLAMTGFAQIRRFPAPAGGRPGSTVLAGLLICCACLDGGFAGSLRAGEPASSDPSAWHGAHVVPSEVAARSQATDSVAAGLIAPAVPLTLSSNELVLLLTRALQERLDPEQGRLELQLLRPWTPVKVPEGPLELVVRELPATGLSPQFILRFELKSGDRSLGVWQTAVQARLWREVWVARTTIRRGTLLREAELVRETRDVLTLREPLADLDRPSPVELEAADVIPAGAPVLARAVRPRPVIRRGQLADAVLQDGALRISLKVEALEDGAPGQIVRIRNPVSRRDLYGRVIDAQTVQVSL